LLVATIFTLFFVPCVYAMIYRRRTARQQESAQRSLPTIKSFRRRRVAVSADAGRAPSRRSDS
jgi:hypothetical protein